MDKVIISSLNAKDFELLCKLSDYLLSLPVQNCDYRFCDILKPKHAFITSGEPFVLTSEELVLLKKLKHLHLLSIFGNGKKY